MVNIFPNPDTLDLRGPVNGPTLATFFAGWIGVDFDGASTEWRPGKLSTRTQDTTATCTVESTAYEGGKHAFVRREELTEAAGGSKLILQAGFFLEVANAPMPDGFTAHEAIIGGLGLVARVQDHTGPGTIVYPAASGDDPLIYIQQPNGYAAYFEPNPSQTDKVDLVIEKWRATVRTELGRATIELSGNASLFFSPFEMRMTLENDVPSLGDVRITVEVNDLVSEAETAGGNTPPDIPGGTGYGKPKPTGGPTMDAMVGGMSGGGLVAKTSTPDDPNAFTGVLTVDDTSNTLITDGRGGIILGKEDEVTFGPDTVQITSHCTYFDANDDSAPILRDEFLRIGNHPTSPQPLPGRVEAHRFGSSGNNLQCDWAYDIASEILKDQQALPYTGGDPHLPTSGWQGHFLDPNDTNPSVKGILVTQPINSPQQEQYCMDAGRTHYGDLAQRHKITFKHPTVGAGEANVEVGFILRMGASDPSGQITGSLDNFRGYVFSIDGNGNCRVRRKQYGENLLDVNPDNDTVELVTSVNIAHSAVERTMEVECYEEPGPSNGDGPVILIFLIDGVQVPFTSTTQTGVSVGATGIIRDAGNERLLAAAGVGLFWSFPATDGVTTHAAEINEIESLTPSPVDPPENDLASISLGDEDDGVTGTLTFPSTWPVTKRIQRPQTQRWMEDGHQVRRGTVTTFRDTFDVEVAAMNRADADSLRDFFDDHDGMDVPFLWTPPEQIQQAFRFANPELHIAQIAPEVFATSFSLQQVHDGG